MRNIHKSLYYYYVNSVGLDEHKDVANSCPKLDVLKGKSIEKVRIMRQF